MKQRIPNPKILCCASVFALSLAACSHNPKPKPDANLADSSKQAGNHLVKLKKGHRSKKLGLAQLPDPRSYDNLWDRLFDRFDLPEVSHQDIDRELNWFINHPAYIERVQSRAEPFLYSIVKQLEKNKMPGELALLPVIESAFQPHVVSPAHAAGIWQFIPATGRHYGLKQSHSYDGRRDIYASTRAAIKYLKKLHNDFNGDWLLAIAGYNCGEGAVSRSIQRNLARGLPTDFWSLDLPQETRSYVPRLLAVAKLFSESEQYGFSLRPIPNKALYKTVKLHDQVDLAMAANAADISLDRLFELNPGFKRQQVDLDGSYRLFIPAHKKIVDFKEELARQMAGQGGYGVQTAAARESDLRVAATAIINAQASAEESAEPAKDFAAADPAPAVEQEPAEQNTVISPAPVVEAPQPSAPDPAAKPRLARSLVAEASLPQQQAPEVPPPAAEALAADDAIGVAPSDWASSQPEEGRRSAQASSLEEAVKAVEEERIAAANAKPKRMAEPKSLPKAEQKDRDEPLSAGRRPASAKLAEQEAASSAREAQAKVQGGRKAEARQHEEVAGRRPPEPEGIGKKTAYVVREGDTVYSIARRYDMDVEDLKKMNRLARADEIKWGQSLTVEDKDVGKKPSSAKAGGNKPVPQQQSAKHLAREGETLFSISRRFNVSVADLRKWNGIKEDKQFRAGMNITVSGEKD